MAKEMRSGWSVGIGTARDADGEISDVVLLQVTTDSMGMSIDCAEQMAKQLLLLVDYLRPKVQEVSNG